MTNQENKENIEVKTNQTENKAVPAKRTETNISKGGQPDYSGPFTLMKHFAEDMEKMFADFGFNRNFSRPSLFDNETFWLDRKDLLKDFSPPVEILERDGNLIFRADLPGMTKDDIKVEVQDNRLTIEGERKQEEKEEGEGFYRSECSYGSFYRELPLPQGVDADTAKAQFKNGVLEVTLAAPEIKTKGKRLEITEDKSHQASA